MRERVRWCLPAWAAWRWWWRYDGENHEFANGVACSNKISWNHENIERVRIKTLIRVMLYGGCLTRVKTWREGKRMNDARVLWVAEKKKRERKYKKTINNKTKKNETKQNRGRRKRSFLSFFFPPVWNVNLERDNRMRKILRRRVRFSCACTSLSCSSLSRGIWLRDRRQKKKIRTNVFVCHFPSLFFFFPFV